MKKKISIVVPMYNEEPVVDAFFKSLYQTLDSIENYEFEIVTVDDGSKDATLDHLKAHQKLNPEIVVVSLSRHLGHEPAVAAGLSVASGEAIIPMDADLQDPPNVIPLLIQKWEEGYEVVNAKRVQRDKDTFLKRKTAEMFYKIIAKWSGKTKVPQNVGHFRLITRKVLDEVLKLGDVTRVFRVEVPFVGFKTAEVEYARPERELGKTHYNYKSMTALAEDSIVITTTEPLRFSIKWSILFVFITALSSLSELALFIVELCGINLGLNDVILMSWLIINVILFVAAFIMVSIAIQSLYISRAFKEAQKRPFFIIDEVIRNSKE